MEADSVVENKELSTKKTMYDLHSTMLPRPTLYGPFDESHRSVKYSLYGPLSESAYPDAYPEDESAVLFIRTHPDQDHVVPIDIVVDGSAKVTYRWDLLVTKQRQKRNVMFRRLMSQESSEALLGDLEEGFSSRAKQSIPKARLWYWRQVILSVAPLAWAALVHRFKHSSRRT
jgi:hypothetical protein